MARPVEAVLIGAGSRGYEVYGQYALHHPEEIRFTAVAEPHPERRRRFARVHGIPIERQFRTWHELYEHGQLAPALVNCTLDRQHLESTLPALEAGYDVLLEKPMATSLTGCLQLVDKAEQRGRLLMIGHVLRYTAFFAALNQVLRSGRLGQIVSVEHRENVVYWHMAHSFVRGNWRNASLESPMILAKCCHDMDILFWNLGTLGRLASFGSLLRFRRERAPARSPSRCTEGCPEEDVCPWYAPRIYLNQAGGWPVSVICEDPSLEARWHALETGPYGRCVYRCDNDVVDHQVVNLEFECGASGVLVMQGHAYQESRTMRNDGAKATLRGKFAYGHDDCIEIHDHISGRIERIEPQATSGGHGGGDARLLAAFVRSLRDPVSAASETTHTTARQSLESHLMAFAAEEARTTGRIVRMGEFRQRAGMS